MTPRTHLFRAAMLLSMLLPSASHELRAQSPAHSRPLPAILSSADSLLRQSYCTTPLDVSRLGNLMARLDDLVKELNAYKAIHRPSPEEWYATGGERLVRLAMRRSAYELAKAGKCDSLRRSSEVEIESYRCEALLREYLADTSATAFVEHATAQQIQEQQEFLKNLNYCLELFVRDEAAFKRMAPLLTKLFVAKRISPELLAILDTGQIQKLTELMLGRPDREAVIDAIMQYLAWETDSQRAMQLMRRLAASEDPYVVNRVLEAILREGADNPQKMLALADLLQAWPRQQGQEKFVQPLLQLLNRVRDGDLLAIVFRELDQQIPAADKQETEKILSLVEDNLFGRKGRRYAQAQRLQDLIARADSLRSLRKTLLILPFYRVGDLRARLDTSYVVTMKQRLAAAFSSSFATEVWDQPGPKALPLLEKRQNAEAGMRVPWQENPRKAALYVASTFEYHGEGQPLALYLRFFDGRDDLLLAGFDETVSHVKKLPAFEDTLSVRFAGVARRLSDLLSAYRHFEDITQTELSSLFDREKLMSYLAYGSYFNLEIDSAYFDQSHWLNAQAIYIEPFDTHGDWTKIAPLEERLPTRLIETYPWLPVESNYAAGSKTYLTIAGKPHRQNPRAYDIELGVNRIRAMTITLNFRSQSSQQALTELQLESAVRFTIQAINNYLGINSQQIQMAVADSIKKIPPEVWRRLRDSGQISLAATAARPALTNALPSLLLAGSPQFLLARQKKVPLTNWRYLLGSALLAGQVAAVSSAVTNGNAAVREVNDRKTANAHLDRRDNYMYAAAGTAVLSAIVAVIDICLWPKAREGKDARP